MHSSCAYNRSFGDVATTAEVLTVINNKVNGNDYSYYTLNLRSVECSIEDKKHSRRSKQFAFKERKAS